MQHQSIRLPYCLQKSLTANLSTTLKLRPEWNQPLLTLLSWNPQKGQLEDGKNATLSVNKKSICALQLGVAHHCLLNKTASAWYRTRLLERWLKSGERHLVIQKIRISPTWQLPVPTSFTPHAESQANCHIKNSMWSYPEADRKHSIAEIIH